MVIGGGVIAERKLVKLLDTGAEIKIVSPEITENITIMIKEDKIEWKKKLFSHEDILGAFLIVAATNSTAVNRQVFEACNDQQLITIVDDPIRSNFIVPSTLNRGKLTISVSTSGASPGFSKQIVSELASHYDESYENYLDFLADCRLKVQSEIADPTLRRKILKNLLKPIFFDLTKRKFYTDRETLFQRLLNNNGEL